LKLIFQPLFARVYVYLPEGIIRNYQLSSQPLLEFGKPLELNLTQWPCWRPEMLKINLLGAFENEGYPLVMTNVAIENDHL